LKVFTAYIPLPLTEQVEERSRLTCEALADVDDTRVIDHQSVQAWANSLDDEEPFPVPR
jgi:hypothetical protein